MRRSFVRSLIGPNDTIPLEFRSVAFNNAPSFFRRRTKPSLLPSPPRSTDRYPRVKFPTVYHGVDLGNVNPSKIVDMAQCPLATRGINEALPRAREDARRRVDEAFSSGDGKRVGKRGATLLFRETSEEGTVTDNNADVSERVNGMVFNFKVRGRAV